MKNHRIQDQHQYFITKFIPKYAIGPFLLMTFVGIFTFWVTPLWTNGMQHFSLETNLDRMLPFIPVFILPYILAYLQWIIGYVRAARTERHFFRKVIFGEIAGKMIVCIVFCVFPTTMVRATITGGDIFSKMVAWMYQIDSPINLFPSIHCMESWICFRISLNKRYFSKRYSVIMGLSTLIICMSTVFIKQHVVLDVFGGILAGEIGLFLGRLITKKDPPEISVASEEL